MENALKAVDDVAEAWRRDRRELKDEVNWLHSELHGAEMEAKKLRELVRDMWFWGYFGHIDSESEEEQMAHIDGVIARMKELGVEE